MYEGCFKADQYDGKGILHDKFGHKIFDGKFEQGVQSGQGIEFDKYSQKKQFEGQWKEGKKNGMGTEYWGNANIKYQGEWKDDMKEGKGIGYLWDGNLEFEGRYVKNQKKYKINILNFFENKKDKLRTIQESKHEAVEEIRKDMEMIHNDLDMITSLKCIQKKPGQHLDSLTKSISFFDDNNKVKLISERHLKKDNSQKILSPKSEGKNSQRESLESPVLNSNRFSKDDYLTEMLKEEI